MNLSDFRTLFAYGDWATDRMLAAAEPLPEDQWTRDLGSSFPSLRDTLAHIVGAEWAWLRRWQGESPRGAPDWKDTATAARLREVLRDVQAGRTRFLDGLREDDLRTVVHFTFLSGTAGAQALGDLMMHVVNHSTYHRGQVATMLRQCGVVPPSTDLYVFNLVRAQGVPAPS